MKAASIVEIARALDAAGARYIVVGGVAVALHGYDRVTYDLDLVLQLRPANIVAAFKALATLGYRPLVPITAEQFADSEMRQAWIDQKGMLVLNMHSDAHRETKIDLFVTEPFDFEREYANAYVQELLPGLKLRLATIDTLIKMKREAGRARDLGDIEELTRIQARLRDTKED